MLKCPYCGSGRLKDTGGPSGNPFDRQKMKTVCLECGRTVWQEPDLDEICGKIRQQQEKEEEKTMENKCVLNERDAAFADQFFSPQDAALLKQGRFDEVKPGHFVEPAYDVLIRMGFLAELRGDYKEAVRCYNGDPLPGREVQERKDRCRSRLPHCVSHLYMDPVDTCTACGKPICRHCRDTQQIYSVSAEAGLPYCKECYDASTRYLQKHGRG